MRTNPHVRPLMYPVRGFGVNVFVTIVLSCWGPALLAAPDGATTLPPVVVSDQSDTTLRLKREEIDRVGVVTPAQIRKKQAQTFAQAVDRERGIDTQTACAFCGAKRVTINGMKGEHTTILIDGLPLHSTVSGFYGIEAIPLTGIDSIEIYRGAGAALSAPESIGGAINIVTRENLTDAAEANLSYATDGQRNVSVFGVKRLTESTGISLGLQSGDIYPVDLDRNLVSEVPAQKTQSVFSKLTHRLNEDDELSVRFSYGKLRSVGGSMHHLELSQAPPPPVSDEFQDRDVRKRFLGDERKITENVNLQRYELASIYRKQLSPNSSLTLRIGGATQAQRSVYSHGYDYDNEDRLWVGMVAYQKAFGENHLLDFGLESKTQIMDSSSQSLYVQRSPPLKQDDLVHRSTGVYLQDTWLIDGASELSAVIRLDDIQTRWSDLDRSVKTTVVAPRAMFKHRHDEVLTSRLSAGIGYRSPLTLFESQHGMTHDGFVVEIDKLETAQSFVYSLAGQRLDDFFEASVHVTRIENMAYGIDRLAEDLPTLFRNSDEAHLISVLDLSYGRRLTAGWTLEGLIEIFDYPAAYKAKLPVAAIERRASVVSNVEWGKWSAYQKFVLIAARDLSSYGYDKHFNIAPSEDPLDASFGQRGEDLKLQRSPAYFTLDVGFERKIDERLTLGFSILNVFDYTQTSAGDSPLTWHEHGDHYHLDNFHIWGPLRGRQLFFSVRGNY